MRATEGSTVRAVVIEPAGCGKTTLARHISKHTTGVVVVHDDPAPDRIDMQGSWVYVAQSDSYVPAAVMAAATAVYRHHDGYTFAVSGTLLDGARVNVSES